MCVFVCMYVFMKVYLGSFNSRVGIHNEFVVIVCGQKQRPLSVSVHRLHFRPGGAQDANRAYQKFSKVSALVV